MRFRIPGTAPAPPAVSYTRGIDLSGSFEGAGGIGGLLARSDHSTLNPQLSTAAYHSDGNGNITCLIGTNQSLLASYRYDPFGNTISMSGSLAEANTYRFSSKELHVQGGLYYYGYRFYDPILQRWMNADPLGEPGFELVAKSHGKGTSDGPNLYTFVHNQPIGLVDYWGLRSWPAGAGRLCVDKKCKPASLRSIRYLPEDDNSKLVPLPSPGECVDADALYAPGFAWKIPDNGKITIKCDNDGCLSDFAYSKWPFWIGTGPIWEIGRPKPPKWPGDIPPYPSEPPPETKQK